MVKIQRPVGNSEFQNIYVNEDNVVASLTYSGCQPHLYYWTRGKLEQVETSEHFNFLEEVILKSKQEITQAFINPSNVKYVGSESYMKKRTEMFLLGFKKPIILKTPVYDLFYLEENHHVNWCNYAVPHYDTCYVNEALMECIEEEKYISINPNMVKDFIDENDYLDEDSKLYHVVFKDNTTVPFFSDNFD